MRGWMNDGKSYIPPVGIGEVMRAGGIGQVVASKDPAFAVGDIVSGRLGVQEYCLAAAGKRSRAAEDRSALGSADAVAERPGHARHDRLLRPAGRRPAEGRARRWWSPAPPARSARPSASWRRSRAAAWSASPAAQEKCDWVVKELGFDACIDYKGGTVREGLKEHCPKGVDVYFDNVGGEILDAVLAARAEGAHRHLRRDQPVQQHHADAGPEELPVAAGQPRAHGRHGGVRLRRLASRRRWPSWRAT